MFELNLLSTGIKTLAMLFIVLGLLVLVLYFMRRILSLRQGSKGELFIRVLSSIHLSPKERIQVIEIAGERMVLGVTQGSISLLTKLSDSGDGKRSVNGKREDDAIRES